LGRRLGLKDKSGKDFFSVGAVSGQPVEDVTAWYEEQLSNELKLGAPAITLDELKQLPGAVWVDKKGTAYRKYAGALSADALKTAVFDGSQTRDGTLVYNKAKADGGTVVGVVADGKAVKGFATPSRKIEFYAKGLETKKSADGKAVNPLPVYEPRDWLPSEEYPLYFVNWKEASHTHSRTQNNPWLLEVKPFGPLVIHPDTAKKYGVEDGDDVWVESTYGRVKGTVKASKRMHPEVVGMQWGWGHTALGKNAKGRGAAEALLRPTKGDPLSGQALHKEACVRIKRA